MKGLKIAFFCFILVIVSLSVSCDLYFGLPSITSAEIPESNKIVIYFTGRCLSEFDPYDDVEIKVYGNAGEVFTSFRITGYYMNGFSNKCTATLNKNLLPGYRIRIKGRHSVSGSAEAKYREYY